jgi:hypothetical protein
VDRQNQQQDEEDRFTIVSLDESFFFYDSLVRRGVWIEQDKRPIVRITGSHKYAYMHFWCHKLGRKEENSYSDSTIYSMEIHSSSS